LRIRPPAQGFPRRASKPRPQPYRTATRHDLFRQRLEFVLALEEATREAPSSASARSHEPLALAEKNHVACGPVALRSGLGSTTGKPLRRRTNAQPSAFSGQSFFENRESGGSLSNDKIKGGAARIREEDGQLSHLSFHLSQTRFSWSGRIICSTLDLSWKQGQPFLPTAFECAYGLSRPLVRIYGPSVFRSCL